MTFRTLPFWLLGMLLGLADCNRTPPVQAPTPTTSSAPASAPNQQGIDVTLRVTFKSTIPQPNANPYPDCLFVIKAEVVTAEAGLERGAPLLITLPAYYNRELTPEAHLKVGSEARMQLVPFETKTALQHFQRSDQTDDFELPMLWCEKLLSAPPPPDFDLLAVTLKPKVEILSDTAALPSADMMRTFVSMHQSFTAKGIRFAVIVVPFKEELSPSYPQEPNYTPELAAQRRALYQDLQTRGIPAIDLYESLSKPDIATQTYYPDGNNHLTALGLRVSAAHIARTLKEWQWTRDLALTPPFQRQTVKLPKADYDADVVTWADGKALETNAGDAPIRIFGDSMVRYPAHSRYGSVEGANLAAQVAFELRLPVGTYSISAGAGLMPNLLRRYPTIWEGSKICLLVCTSYYAFQNNEIKWLDTSF